MKPTPSAQTKETKEVSSQDINLKDLFEAKSVTDNIDTTVATQQEQYKVSTAYRPELPPKTELRPLRP